MITGRVNEPCVPLIELVLGDRTWSTIIDTGFNGYLELPEELQSFVAARYYGLQSSQLAGGVVIEEEAFTVQIPFDGEPHRAAATFVPVSQILIGTALLREYRLHIDFPARTVQLERVTAG